MSRAHSYYDVLGVSHSSEPEVIEAAYRALIRKHHPDANSDGTATSGRASEINEAFAVLGNARRRKAYDLKQIDSDNVPVHWQPAENEKRVAAAARPAQDQLPFKRCGECAEEIQRLAKVCRFCGARQDGQLGRDGQTNNIHTHVYTSPSPPPMQLLARAEPKYVEAPRRSSGWLYAIIIILLLILWLVAVSDPTPTSVSNEAENVENITNVEGDTAAEVTPNPVPNASQAASEDIPQPAPDEAVGNLSTEPPADEAPAEQSNQSAVNAM